VGVDVVHHLLTGAAPDAVDHGPHGGRGRRGERGAFLERDGLGPRRARGRRDAVRLWHARGTAVTTRSSATSTAITTTETDVNPTVRRRRRRASEAGRGGDGGTRRLTWRGGRRVDAPAGRREDERPGAGGRPRPDGLERVERDMRSPRVGCARARHTSRRRAPTAWQRWTVDPRPGARWRPRRGVSEQPGASEEGGGPEPVRRRPAQRASFAADAPARPARGRPPPPRAAR